MIRRKEECKVEVREAMKGGPGSVVQTSFASKEELLNKARLFGNLHLEPNCGIGVHTHEGESELFYIVNGTVVYNDDGVEHELHAGDLAVVEPGHSHGVSNRSDAPADLVALIVLQ